MERRDGPVIDVHTHAFPDLLAPRAIAALTVKGNTRAHTDGTIDGLVSSMKTAGIVSSVVCSIATDTLQYGPILKWSREIADRKIIPFPSLHPRSPLAAEELAEIAQKGFRGIKLHPEYQDFTIDDPSLADFYRGVEKSRLIILFHAGYDIGFPDSDRSAPARIAQVKASYPGITAIASHLGGFRRWDEVLDVIAGRDIYLDTSFTIGHISEDIFREIVGRHRPDRLLFGSDSPWTNQEESIAQIARLNLGPEREHLLFFENARELLGLPPISESL
jgi:predicted TIM-barrel fold metal-dependent hydrolase